MPAMGVRAAFYEPLALNLGENGINAVTADLRGLGASSVRVGRGTDFGYHDMLALDWPAVVDAVRSRFPRSRIFLLGHSLGGQLNALYASVHPQTVDGLILVASCSVFYRGWPFPGNYGIWLGTQSAMLLAEQNDLIVTLPSKAATLQRDNPRVAIKVPPFDIPPLIPPA